jgi:hypothetical protein
MLTTIVVDNPSGNEKLVMDSSNTGMKPKYLDTKVSMKSETDDSVACSPVMEGVKPCMNIDVKNTDSSGTCILVEDNNNVGSKVANSKTPIKMQCNIKSRNGINDLVNNLVKNDSVNDSVNDDYENDNNNRTNDDNKNNKSKEDENIYESIQSKNYEFEIDMAKSSYI